MQTLSSNGEVIRTHGEQLGPEVGGDATYKSPPPAPVDLLDILWAILTGLMMLVSLTVIYLTLFGREILGHIALSTSNGGWMTMFGHWDVPNWPHREPGGVWLSPAAFAWVILAIGAGTIYMIKKPTLRDGKGYGILLIINVLLLMMMGACAYTRFVAFSWGYH